MRVAFIGPVGAGKTTQAQRLALALPNYVPRVSSGELVRAHIEAKTELGRRMRGCYHRGEAVPDEVADDVLEVLGHPERSAFYALDR